MPITTRRSLSTLLLVLLLGLTLSSCAPPPSEGERPGLTGAVGPVARTCHGVGVSPGDDIQKVLDTNPPGTTICLSAGVYRLAAPLVPRTGDALVGELGAVLNGSKVLTGWRSHGKDWSTTGFLPRTPSNDGECLRSAPSCGYPEDVFVDKRRLRRVASPAMVVPGTVYADYATNTLTIGDDPRNRLVEQAVAPSLVQATVDDVTVANLVMEQAANEAQTGAIESRSPRSAGSGWQILHNKIRLNHGVGVGFGGHSRVSGNVIDHQGQLGFGAWGRGSVVDDNEISFNGAAGYSFEWEAGGSKSWRTEDLTISHNYVHDNMGPGLWTDGGNIDTTYTYNEITDNWGAGIQHEISYDATISHNEISGNGRRHMGWAWEAGIQIQSSGGNRLIGVAHNVLVDNANGITLIDSGGRAEEQPRPHGPHVVQNVFVHDNSITMTGVQSTGAFEDTENRAIFTSNHNRFEANTYHLDSLTSPHFGWDGEQLAWRGWRGLGNDRKGAADLLPR